MVSLLDFSEQIKSFYLVRHGETLSTNKGKICGHDDVALTELGIAQGEILASWFLDLKIDSIFSSPLSRASETADIIAKAIRKPTYYKHSGLLEKKEGAWEGKTYWQVREEEPKAWEKWSKDPIDYAPPEGESVRSFVARVGRAMDDIRKNYEIGQKIVLTTHAGVIRAIIIHTLDIPVENFFRIDVPAASISRVDWSDSFSTLKFCGLHPEVQELMLA
jgi:broad specificity phosphatase PhoE